MAPAARDQRSHREALSRYRTCRTWLPAGAVHREHRTVPAEAANARGILTGTGNRRRHARFTTVQPFHRSSMPQTYGTLIACAHVVTTGETLLSIASRFGVAPQTIAYDNGISDSAQLKVGASLVIPPFDAAIHVMAAGDTVSSVAARFGLDPDAVRAVNRIASDDGDAIEGRALLIPVLDARYPGFRLHLSDAPRV